MEAHPEAAASAAGPHHGIEASRERKADRFFVFLLFIQFVGFLTFYRSTDLTQFSAQAYFTALPSIATFFILCLVLRDRIGPGTFLGTAISPLLGFVAYGLLSSAWAFFPLIAAAKNLVLLVQIASVLMFIQLAGLRGIDVPRCILIAVFWLLSFGIAINIAAFGDFFNFATPIESEFYRPAGALAALLVGGYRERMQLIATHALDVSNILAIAAILCLFIDIRFIARLAATSSLLVLLYFAGGRASLIGLALSCAAAWTIRSHRLRIAAMAALLIASLFIIPIWDLFAAITAQTDSAFAGIESLNGRIPVWRYGLESVFSDGFATLFGFGRESGRALFQGIYFSPGDSHHAFLEVLLSYGLVGLSIVVWLVARLCRVAARSRLGFALMTYTLILSTQGAYIFIGGFFDFVVMLTLGYLAANSGAYADRPRLESVATEPRPVGTS